MTALLPGMEDLEREVWQDHWRGMPEFIQGEEKPVHSLDVHLRSEADVAAFEERFGRIYHGKWMWYPEKRYGNWRRFRYVTPEPVLPRYPVYIISKGRADTRMTARSLDALSVPYHIVVEPQEADVYRSVIDPAKVLVLPFSNLGLGSIPARNWVWDHAAASGAARHWILDDNIQGFYRLNRNSKIQPTSGVMFRAAEDFVDRYENVAIAGFQYESLTMRRESHPAFALNTRVYSCTLLRNDLPYRWRGRYNEDTDLCLRALKDGWVTVLFYAFLANKVATMTVAGGNTDELYAGNNADVKEEDGRWKMAEALRILHPDVTKVIRKWNRWQHQVDYSPFAKNALRPVQGLEVPEGADEYGMELRDLGGAEPEVEEVKPVTFTFKRSGPVGPMPRIQVSMAVPEQAVPEGWRPDEPPDLRAWGVREVGLDFETTGLRWWAGDRPVGVAVSWEGQGGRVESRYLPWGHRGGNMDEGAARRWFHDQLPGLSVKNLQMKFDAHFAQEWGADFDAMGCRLGDVAHYAALLDDHRGEGWRRPERPFSLEAVGLDYAGEGKVKDPLDKSRMAEYHAHAVTAYARQDAALVLKVWRAQRPLLEAEGLLEVAALEDSVIPVVVEMERNAARIDVEKLRRWTRQSEERLFALRLQLAKDVGWDVNPDSPEDMARLFRQLNIKAEAFTETCPNCSAKTEGAPVCPSCGAAGRESFAADVLREHEENPTIARVVHVSHLADLRSKFLVPYDDAVGDDGLLRFEFHQLRGDKWGTVSGRFSASKPTGSRKGANVQQVYAVDNQVRMHCAVCAAEWGRRKTRNQVSLHRAEHEDVFLIRELFVPDPEPGVVLAASDAEQIEYRTFAHLSRSPRLLDAYRKDPRVDFHEWTGAEVRKFQPDFERKRLKMLNFSLLFGAGVEGTVNLLNVSEEEAKELRAFYFQTFPEAKGLMDAAMDVAFTPGRYRRRDSQIMGRGYVKTILGRRARFPMAKRLHAALNRAVSGSAADLNKMKLRTLYGLRKELGLKMRMTIHDEVVGDIPRENAPRLAEVMDRQEVPLSVPILWDTRTGANWADCK